MEEVKPCQISDVQPRKQSKIKHPEEVTPDVNIFN